MMILRKLVAFLIVSLLLLFVFAYRYWIRESECLNIWACLKRTIINLFEFEPPEIGFTEIMFGVLIVIVLLNVVIAIVGEAWKSSAEKSAQMFWMFRLEKIFQLQYAIKVWDKCGSFWSKCKYHPLIALLTKVDSLENISLRDNISWTNPPYHSLTMKDHYDNPIKYFSPNDSLKIIDAHSLQADLLWNNKTEDTKLMLSMRFSLLVKWLGCCLFYTVLVVLGIPLCGILWPKKFRAGVLSIGLQKAQNVIESDKTAVKNLRIINGSLMQQLADAHAELGALKHDYDSLLTVTNLTEVNSSLM